MALYNHHVFLLHGLGSHPASLWPLQWYLARRGFKHVHSIGYAVDTLPLTDAVAEVSTKMLAACGDRAEPVLVVGQSMGGLVANRLHEHGWTVARAVCVASPLHGARLLNTLHSWLPTRAWDALHKPAYQLLMTKGREAPPPHPVSTISFGWAWSSFDGCVYADEVELVAADHMHLTWADHRVAFVDPRLWRMVHDCLVSAGRPQTQPAAEVATPPTRVAAAPEAAAEAGDSARA